MKRLLMALALMVPSLAQADDCAPKFELVLEAGVTSVSTIYAHVEMDPNMERLPECPEPAIQEPWFSLTYQADANALKTPYPFTVLTPYRVKFVPQAYGIYGLTATVTDLSGSQTTHYIVFRKGPQ